VRQTEIADRLDVSVRLQRSHFSDGERVDDDDDERDERDDLGCVDDDLRGDDDAWWSCYDDVRDDDDVGFLVAVFLEPAWLRI
jgi:hypothetical protein